mgnify:CR=1 FL=1
MTIDMDIEIESLEHWWALEICIPETEEKYELIQTYHEWRRQYPEGVPA